MSKNMPMRDVLWNVKGRYWNVEVAAKIRYALVVGALAWAWAAVVFCLTMWVL